jgi:hypothetical protein
MGTSDEKQGTAGFLGTFLEAQENELRLIEVFGPAIVEGN